MFWFVSWNSAKTRRGLTGLSLNPMFPVLRSAAWTVCARGGDETGGDKQLANLTSPPAFIMHEAPKTNAATQRDVVVQTLRFPLAAPPSSELSRARTPHEARIPHELGTPLDKKTSVRQSISSAPLSSWRTRAHACLAPPAEGFGQSVRGSSKIKFLGVPNEFLARTGKNKTASPQPWRRREVRLGLYLVNQTS